MLINGSDVFIVDTLNSRILKALASCYDDRANTVSFAQAFSSCTAASTRNVSGSTAWLAEGCSASVPAALVAPWVETLPVSEALAASTPDSGQRYPFKFVPPKKATTVSSKTMRKLRFALSLFCIFGVGACVHATGNQRVHKWFFLIALACIWAGSRMDVVLVPWPTQPLAAVVLAVLVPWVAVPSYLVLQAWDTETGEVSCSDAVLWELHVFTALAAVANLSLWQLWPGVHDEMEAAERQRADEEELALPLPDFVAKHMPKSVLQVLRSQRMHRVAVYAFWLQSGINDAYADGNFTAIARRCGFQHWAKSLVSLATATIIQNLTTAILAFVSQHYFIGVVCLAGPPPLGSMGLTKILWIALVAAAIRIITEDLPQLTLQGIFIFQVTSSETWPSPS